VARSATSFVLGQRSGRGGVVVIVGLWPCEGWGGPCVYDVVPGEVLAVLDRFSRRGVSAESIMVNEMAPPCEVLQGEYLNDPGLCWGYFLYSRERARMRDALRIASSVSQGLRSDLMLREAMTPSSYEDWRALLDQYPDHVLEVSIFDRCLGDIPGRNALVWEVRRY
jgi:hypothetical protein